MKINRRAFCTGAALGVATACSRHRGSGFPGYALIATAGETSVAVVDLMQFRLADPIFLGTPPSQVIPGEDGTAFVLTPASGSVHLVGRNLKVSDVLHLAPDLVQIRPIRSGKSLLGICQKTSELIQADVGRFRIAARHRLKSPPRTMDVVEELVAVSEGDSGWVELFDLKTGRHWSRQLGAKIGDLRFRADGQLLLVSNFSGRSLTALSVPELEVIADLPLAMQPENLCFNRDQGQLFVTGDGMDGVAIVFPYRVLQVDQTVLAGRDPGYMACSENPALLFVASASGSDVCILNIDSRKVVSFVDLAQHPTYITITPDDQYALILNRESGNLAFIHIPAIRTNPAVVINKLGAALFTMFPVGQEPVHAAVIAQR